jgi:chemotaxis protein MotA
VQLIGLALLVVIVAYGFSTRDMTRISAFDPHALVIVLGGSLSAILASSKNIDSLRTLLCLRELLPFPGPLQSGTKRMEDERSRFAALWREGRRAQALEIAQNSRSETVRKMLDLVIARAPKSATDTVFMELRHAELARWQPATSNWGLLARLGPSFGIVGTVTGMIQMFRGMGTDDLNIGAAMSLALVATLYGIAFGAGIAGPIGHYLRGLLDERLGAIERCKQTVIELAQRAEPRG